jgi:hypothetical protein
LGFLGEEIYGALSQNAWRLTLQIYDYRINARGFAASGVLFPEGKTFHYKETSF